MCDNHIQTIEVRAELDESKIRQAELSSILETCGKQIETEKCSARDNHPGEKGSERQA